jgi:hypothetical protein
MSTQGSLRRAYLGRAAICGVAYAVLTYGMKLAIREFSPHGLLLTAMAVAPALAIIAYFILFARYLMEVDEYQRHRMVQALLIATGVMLSVSSVMDFLQAYAQRPPLEPFIFTLSFMLVFVVAQAVLHFLDGRRA